MTPGAVPVLEMRGTVLVFGGCYSNLQATRALLGEARRLGIPPQRIICTGDLVAYGADAAATVDIIRRAGVQVVMGNCEESLGARALDCGCGFTAGSACDRLSAAWYSHAAGQLDDEVLAWMRSLPRRIDLLIDGRHLAVVHGSPDQINAFIFGSASDDALRQLVRGVGCDGVIGGHCGLPFTRLVDGLLWHNPGAIGVPANDGTPRVWFSVLKPDHDGIEIRHLPLEYEHGAAAAAMRAARLPEEYADALSCGLWPSLDVLPPEELARTGRALAPQTLHWPTVA